MGEASPDAVDTRPTSPIVFEKIDTLPFLDSHVRRINSVPAQSTISETTIGRVDGVLEESLASEAVHFSGAREQCKITVERALQLATQTYGVASLELQTTETIPVPYKHEQRKLSEISESSQQSSDRVQMIREEPLEDYDNIDTTKVDRYGFFAHAMQRRISDSTVQEVRARSQSLKRKSTISRAGFKRASMNLGLSRPTDLLETSKVGLHDTTKEVQRSRKWTRMAKRENASAPFMFEANNKLKARVFKGIPDCWRSSAWYSFLTGPNCQEQDRELVVKYKQLNKQGCDCDEQIDLDVPRTISGHVLFRNRHEGGQRLLFRVLHAITLQHESPGYVQGMASVAATLLCYYTEENAFIMLHRLWTRRTFADLYEPGFSHLLKAFERLELRMSSSLVGRHLLSIGCNALAWATRWYLTIFHISVPFHTQLRIWDILMYYDNPSDNHKFAVLEATTLALIEGIEELLLGCEFDQAMRILTMPIDVQDNDRLVHAIQRKLR